MVTGSAPCVAVALGATVASPAPGRHETEAGRGTAREDCLPAWCEERGSSGVQDFDLDGKTTRVFDRQQARVYRYYHSEMGACL